MRWRPMLAVIALVATSVALVAAEVAGAGRYAGPKTWLQGWDQDSPWDNPPFYWHYNEMGPKADDACYGTCTSRVTFINQAGSWSWSVTSTANYTWTGIPCCGNETYIKKAYCKNNSSYVYTAECWVVGN